MDTGGGEGKGNGGGQEQELLREQRARSTSGLRRSTYQLYGVQDFSLLTELLHVHLEERQVVISLRDMVQEAGVVTQLSLALTTTVYYTSIRED